MVLHRSPLSTGERQKLVGLKLSLSPPLQLPMMFLAMSLGPTPLEAQPHRGSIPYHTALTPELCSRAVAISCPYYSLSCLTILYGILVFPSSCNQFPIFHLV